MGALIPWSEGAAELKIQRVVPAILAEVTVRQAGQEGCSLAPE